MSAATATRPLDAAVRDNIEALKTLEQTRDVVGEAIDDRKKRSAAGNALKDLRQALTKALSHRKKVEAQDCWGEWYFRDLAALAAVLERFIGSRDLTTIHAVIVMYDSSVSSNADGELHRALVEEMTGVKWPERKAK